METQERIEIDWLSMSPRTMARVMEISNELGITPQKAFELMADEAAEKHPNLPLPLSRPITPTTTPDPKRAA